MLNFIFARDLLSAFGLGTKKIKQILSKDDISDEEKLNQLLSEEETLTECKSSNAQLIEFLSKPEILKKLIHFATRFPQNIASKDQAYKYPFLSADILSSSAKLAEALISVKEVPAVDSEPEEESTQETTPNVVTSTTRPGEEANPNDDDADTEANAIQKVLDKAKEKEEAKTTLVEDLDEIELEDNDDFEQNFKHLEGEGGEPPKRRERVGISDKKEGDDDYDEVNVDDEDDEEGKKGSNKPNITVRITKSNASKMAGKGTVLTSDNYDYSMMDELFGILESEHGGEEIEAILCGYFNKIVQALLNKIKIKMLHYMLIKRKGDIFSKLLNVLQHHSLAQLIVELMQVKIPSQEKMSGDKESDGDEAESPAKAAEELQPENMTTEQQMRQILNEKRQEVISTLIERLGPKSTDFESVLNAQTVLTELSDSKKIYKRIIGTRNIQTLVNHACDISNRNQAYALNVLANILKQLGDYDHKKDAQEFIDFKIVLQKSFNDITYSSLLILRGSDSQIGETPALVTENQAGVQIKKFGAKRMRALELLRQIIQTLSKEGDISIGSFISKILKNQIITTLLNVIEDYEFSNVANQLSIQILYLLKTIYDDSDVELLKNFVRRNLSSNDKTHFEFSSGNKTTKAHLASIINMALELKKLTLEGGLLKPSKKSPAAKSSGAASSDSDDSSDEAPTADDAEATERALRHVNDRDWTKFCSGPLKYFETKWTKKLEDYDKARSESSSQQDQEESGSDEEKDLNVFAESKKGGSQSNLGSRKDRYRVDSKDDEDDEEDDDDEQESIIESLLKSDKFNNKKREPIKSARPTREELDLAKEEKEQEKQKETLYFANQYWHTPTGVSSSIDDLLKEEGFEF